MASPSGNPIAEQHARNQAMLADAGVDLPATGGGGPSATALDGLDADVGDIHELFLDQKGPEDEEEKDRADLGLDPALGDSLNLSEGTQAVLELAADFMKCGECDKLSTIGSKECPDGHDLSSSVQALDQLVAESDGNLELAALDFKKRKELPKSAFVFPDKAPGSGSYPIHDLAHAKNALSRASGKPEEKAVMAAVLKRYPELKKGEGKSDLSQEHAVTIFEKSLQLGEVRKDGLLWKPICKTGTLALSPGPGQVDVDKPLELTQTLFNELKRSVDEQAFPYVTVPSTHGNGLLENTGFVRRVEIADSSDPKDPAGTKLLMAGIEFTEPDIAEKVQRGTIPDTSVGVKFNYRNKRSGKTYPAALEHVALTHQPWVDGLTPFGQSLSQEGVFDQDEANPQWDGVYCSVSGESEEEPAAKEHTDGGDILPEKDRSDTVPSVSDKGTEKDGLTAEKLFASQQAEIESERAKREKLERDLSLAQGTIASTSEQLHAAAVEKRVGQLQDAGFPPAFLTKVEQIMLADKPVSDGESALNLSLAGAGEDGGAKDIGSATELVEFLLSGLPLAKNGDVASLVLSINTKQATARESGESAGDKADGILEEAGLREAKPATSKEEGKE